MVVIFEGCGFGGTLSKGGKMSAFIVSDKTINTIVNWLRYDKEFPGHDNAYGYAAKRIEKLGFNLSHKESAEMLCHELYTFN